MKTAKETLKSNTKRTRLKPGIHTGVYLEEAKVTETANGKPFLEFMFVKKDSNEIAPKRVWFPSEKPYLREGETEEQAAQREINEALGHIVTILECYVSSDESEIVASSFAEFCDIAVQRIMASSFEELPVRLKLIYDSDGKFTAFPRFPNYIERDVVDKPVNLYFSKWELANRMTPAVEETMSAESNSSIVVSDELPF